MNTTMRPWLAAMVTIALLTGCDRFLSVEQRLERAQTAFDAGQDSAAMADVKAALDREPGNAAGRVLLARLALRVGDPATARAELERATQAGADHAAVLALEQDVMRARGRYDELLASATADKTSPPHLRLLAMADAQMGLGRSDEARKSLDAALAAAPDDRDVRLADARWLWAAGRIAESTAALDKLLVAHPEFARAAFYRGRLAMSIGDAKGAQAALDAARKHMVGQLSIPEQLGVFVGLVESRLAAGDLAGAETELAALSQRAPDAFPTHFLKARIANARRDFPAATTELRRALTADPGNVPARLLLGAVLIEQGSLEQADSTLTPLLAERPDNIEARKLLARVYLARRDPVGARRVLAEAPADAARDPGADWLSGSILLMGGQTDEGIAMLEQSAAAAPNNAEVRLDLANAYLLTGRRDEALRTLRAMPQDAGGLRRRQLLVLAEASGKDPATARQAIQQLARDNPGDVGLRVAGGFYLLSAGVGDAARGLFEEALRAEPRNVDALLGVAAAEQLRGDAAAAEKGFRKVLDIDASNERAFIALASLARAKLDRGAAAKWLAQSISANPSAVESRLQLADLAFADKDPVKANALLEQALAVTRTRAVTLDRVGQVLLRASQIDAALQRFNEAASLGVAQAQVNAGVALMALGRGDEARARLEAAVRERPTWVAPNVLLAQLDTREKLYDRALERVAAFEKAGGPEATAEELRGDVLFAAGRAAPAAEAYARASRLRPSATLALRAYRAARAAGRAAPEVALTAWLADHPRDPLVGVALAEHYQRTGNRGAAITQYERAVEAWPGAEIMNNLAWLYQQAGDPRATQMARRAHEAKPENPDIADTYGWILVESGNIVEGLPILERAARASPNAAEIQYHYAAALVKSGKKEAAATVLGKLITDNVDFPSRRAAETLLGTLR